MTTPPQRPASNSEARKRQAELAAEQDAVTESGRRIGDPCEAIEGVFAFGPSFCMKASVAVAVDPDWGTRHVVCGEHTPPFFPPEVSAS